MISLGLNRLNGRFLWMTIGLIAILLAITLYAQWLLNQSATAKDALTSNNRVLTQSVNDIKENLQQLEAQVYQYASQLEKDLDMEIMFNVDSVLEQVNSLKQHPAVISDRKSKPYSKDLEIEIRKLEKNIDDFLLVMQTVHSRYPGMPILLDMMEPTNRQFSEAVELAIQEGAMTDFNPSSLEEDQYRVMQILQELRFAWSQQISWFRVFVANRMGAFGDPEVSMRRNLANRDMFAKNVKYLLDKLSQFDKKRKLGLQQAESLLVMKESVRDYERYLQQASSIYLSENWRSDLPLLRDKIQPNLTMVRFHLSLLEDRFKAFSDKGLTDAQRTSTILTSFIWLFTGAISGLLIIGYMVYERSIRRPMLQMTGAMEAEARGQEMAQIQDSDVTEILQLQNAFNGMREQVRSRQTRLESIFDNAAEGIIIIDEQGKIDSINSAALNLFGYEQAEVLGKSVNLFIPEEQHMEHDRLMQSAQDAPVVIKSIEAMAVNKQGEQFPMSIKVSEFTIGGKRLFTAMVDDVSERHAVMQSLRFMAEHDSLTGLYNRQYIMVELERAVENAKRNNELNMALLYIDLDNFKYINDTMGHLAGDRLLMEISGIFSKRIRKGDALARLGGDEFAVLLANVEPKHAEQAADYYRDEIARYKFQNDGKQVDVGCSIGVAVLNDTVKDKEDILARADIACHMAKRAGRNRVHIYTDVDQQSIEDMYFDMGWSKRIKMAIENDQFEFAYQPIVRTAKSIVHSYEVLLRMRDTRTDELLLPNVFLSSADRFGLIEEIDCWVVENAVRRLIDIHKISPTARLSINLSAKSLNSEKVLQTIHDVLESYPVDPSCLIFEITEDVAISDITTAISFIKSLKKLGCKTALDDFGVGYSSFSYLKELPVDIVKIDGSFIRNINDDKLNYALVKSMNDICHTLGKQTVAEFVESEAISRILDEIGVDFQQGYHIGMPEFEIKTSAEEKRENNIISFTPS